MDLTVLQAFVKHAMLGDDTPVDYYPVRAAVAEMFPKLAWLDEKESGFKFKEKRATWSWKGFKEGFADEGVPIGGATIGAGFGAMHGKALTGAALGYAAGSGVSILRSKLRGEKPSTSRKVLALSGLGYGMGGMTHAGLGSLAGRIAKPGSRMLNTFGHHVDEHALSRGGKFLRGFAEEGIPAIGAATGAGAAMATQRQGQE